MEKFWKSTENVVVTGSLQPDPETIENALALFDIYFSLMSNNREKARALADECYDAIGETTRREADEICRAYKKWLSESDMMIGKHQSSNGWVSLLYSRILRFRDKVMKCAS